MTYSNNDKLRKMLHENGDCENWNAEWFDLEPVEYQRQFNRARQLNPDRDIEAWGNMAAFVCITLDKEPLKTPGVIPPASPAECRFEKPLEPLIIVQWPKLPLALTFLLLAADILIHAFK